MKTTSLAIVLILTAALCSACGSKLKTYCVSYQSVRTTFEQPAQVPPEAKIAVFYTFSPVGEIIATVYNRTDEILTIDQTKSFFVDTDGTSKSYFDPTVRTTTTTDMSQVSSGGSMNLGALGSAFGIGGTIGRLLGGINVGGSNTQGEMVSNTTYRADMPEIAIGPRGNGNMTKKFKVTGLGWEYIDYNQSNYISNPYYTADNSPKRFSVCITYKVGLEGVFQKLVTDFYVSGEIIEPVADSQSVNASLRKVYMTKPDALYQPWFQLYLPNNSDEPSIVSYKDGINDGLIYDFN